MVSDDERVTLPLVGPSGRPVAPPEASARAAAAGSAPDVQVLRERAAAALEAALGFVEAHGDPLTRSKARALVGACPPGELEAAVAERQRDDGAVPGLAPAAGLGGITQAVAPLGPELAGTLEALAALGDLRLLAGPAAEACVGWLGRAQREDGSWGSAEDDGARIVSTGFTAGLLGRTRFSREVVLERAGEFLGARFTRETLERGEWPVLAAFSSFFSNVHHDLADAALQWCGREIERGFRTGSLEAARVLRIFLLCDSSAVPGARIGADELVQTLLGEQARDGGFGELHPGGPAARAPVTFDAMLGLIRLCRNL